MFKRNRKNKPQTLMILIALCAVLALVGGVASLASSKPSVAKTITKPVPTNSIVSAPVDVDPSSSITDAEVNEVVRTSKQEQYCYRFFAALKEPRQTEQIDKCLVRTQNWSTEHFIIAMPPNPIN